MKIIAFEGIDAAGKETQIRLLTAALKKKGYRVIQETLPQYHTPIGALINDFLSGKVHLSESALHVLFEADRYDLQEDFDALDSICDVLILDRYVMSNLAFGAAKGLDLEWLHNLQSGLRKPDVTIVLDISARESFRRKKRRDVHEQDVALLERAREAYLQLADEAEGLVYVVDGAAEKELVHQTILSYVELLLKCD